MDAALEQILARAQARPRNLSVDDLTRLVSLEDPAERRAVYAAAYAQKCRVAGKRVSMRGLVEIGNVCAKDCLYCGIRRSNATLDRYRLSVADILRMAEVDAQAGYASLVLQGGEIEGEANTAFIEDCLRAIAHLNLGVTLSLGEQEEDVYRRWRAAGAARYLLRIETSSPELYARLHPADHSWTRRVQCLVALRRCGYQVGTGVMCALPGQTMADLARDIVFFGDMDVDMIGMGPYIPHPDTPLGEGIPWSADAAARRLELGLRMIAVARLHLHDVNIASATALQALDPDGRETGLLAGANVMMPNIRDVGYRANYQLYLGKPCLEEDPAASREKFERRVAAIGETIKWNARGDSPHWEQR